MNEEVKVERLIINANAAKYVIRYALKHLIKGILCCLNERNKSNNNLNWK